MTQSHFNPNNNPPVFAVSNADGESIVELWADPITHNLLVSASAGSLTGTLTNNNAAPGATNIGSLVALANAAPPSYGEGKQTLLSVDLSGALRVTGSLSVGGTTDNSTYTAGSSTGTPAMGFYHSTIDTVTDGRSASLAIDSKRNLFTVLRDAAGNARGANVNASNQLSVSVDNSPVLGAGTAVIGHVIVDSGAITATLSAETTKVIGTVNIAASQTIAVTNTGTFVTQSTLAAETTKVIGTVRNGDGAGNLFTSNSTTYTAKFAQDSNLLGTLGTAFSTAGKVDVKGADGDVFVRQATASNLNATVVGTGTFAVQATLAAETTKVIGVTRTADGAGNLLTSTSNALDVNLKTSAATNISTNLAQVNGVTTLAGNGTSGTGAQRVTIASDSTGQVAPAANATATGVSISYQSALTNSKVAVKASAGNFYGYRIYNPNTAWVYIQLFNVASASVTLGTTAPTDVIPVPPSSLVDEMFTIPTTFGTAITLAATTTASGLTAPTSTLIASFRYL